MKKTRLVKIGKSLIGKGTRVKIQSMTNTKTSNISATVKQIKRLEVAGCDIVRVSVPDYKSAYAISEIKKEINIPLVADIHFDYKLALFSIENGADKIRINPGNIGKKENLKKITDKAFVHGVPIRIGVNAGSLENDLIKKYGEPNHKALVESALRQIKIMEDLYFSDIVVSLKHSNVVENIKAYELISKKIDYPLHLGVTEAGTFLSATVKSSIAIGYLLYKGVGDTIRVSLSDEVEKEIMVAKKILSALNIIDEGVEIISCPTCARTVMNVIEIANELEERTLHIKKNLKVAVMGCLVNGPGEAKGADLGVCGVNEADSEVMFFKKGKIIEKIKKEKVLERLLREIEEF